MISIFEAVAEADNESRRQNILWGINRRLENGTSSMYFRRCYGYINDSDGNPVICPEEAAIVQLIFELYLGGMSIIGIISELASRGVKSPTGKDNWCKRSIDTILSNEKYIGNSLIFKIYSAGYQKPKESLTKMVSTVSLRRWRAILQLLRKKRFKLWLMKRPIGQMSRQASTELKAKGS